jgi:hypothetical protein
MDQNALINKARAMGLGEKISHQSKKSLVRTIQKAQGQSPCFLSDTRYVCDAYCEWARQCKALTAAWLR